MDTLGDTVQEPSGTCAKFRRYKVREENEEAGG